MKVGRRLRCDVTIDSRIVNMLGQNWREGMCLYFYSNFSNATEMWGSNCQWLNISWDCGLMPPDNEPPRQPWLSKVNNIKYRSKFHDVIRCYQELMRWSVQMSVPHIHIHIYGAWTGYECALLHVSKMSLAQHQLRSQDIDRLVQERRNSSALAMELRFSCINPSICLHFR